MEDESERGRVPLLGPGKGIDKSQAVSEPPDP